MKRYPSYKPSGVEWLGEIPIDWECKTLKRITKFAYGDSLPDEKRKGGDVPVYGSNGVVGFHDIPITNAPCIIVGRKGSYGRVNFSEIPCFPIDTSYFVDSTKTNYNLYWLKYFLSILRLDENTLDDMVPGLSREWAYRMPGLIISLPEQNSIVRFLDHKTGQIDRFITNRQKQIELLKEQKAGIINKAVTRGINPDVKLKPSGIEWIEEIPNEWKVIKLKFVAKLQSGEGITSDDIKEVGDYPVYGGNGIRGFTGSYTNDGEFVLIGRQGALCGNINYASGKFWASEHAVVAYLRKPTSILWLGELLKVMNLNQYSQAAAQPGLSVERIKNLLIPFPNYQVQSKIELFIKTETSTIDTLISKFQKQIDLMQEYRTSLISHAVTGKIDVRDWKPKNSNN